MANLIERRASIAFRLHFAERLGLSIAQIVALGVELNQINREIEREKGG